MKWFRHSTSARRSDLIREIREKMGMKWVGHWYHLLELITERYRMGEGNEFVIEMPTKTLLKELDSGHRSIINVLRFSALIEVRKVIDISFKDDQCRLHLLQVADIADNYSKVRRSLDVETTSSRRTNCALKSKSKGKSKGKRKSKEEDIVCRVAPYSPPSTPKTLHELAELWNRYCTELPRVISTGAKRLTACKRALKENDAAYWTEVFKQINTRSFLLGENDRGWVANFDWAIRPGSSEKVLEGNYQNRRTLPGAEKLTPNELRLRELENSDA